MDDPDHGVHVNPHQKAHRTVAKPVAVTWPLPIDRRLDQLVERANEAGAGTSRTELLAAIVAGATVNGHELLQLVVQWRRFSVGDVVLDVDGEADVVYLPRYRPGRRRGAAG